MALATTTLSLRARSDAGAADASGGLVRRRATASRRARVRVLASSMDADSEAPGTSDEYNEMMQKAMGNPYEYRHEDGIYYTVIKEQLIVGGQPQSAADVRRLARDEGVTHLVNLQQDKDIAYWGIDYDEIRAAAEEESVTILRHPARDFDPNSLRNSLPAAVAAVDAVVRGGGRAYVHCTAGLGRAPGVGIAYLYWCEGLGSLDEAYEYLTERRPCGPKREAVRGATHDLLLAEGAELGEWDGQAYHEAPEDAYTRLSEPQRAAIARFLRESPEAAAALSETARANAHAAFGQAEAASREGAACDNKTQSLLGKLMGTNKDATQ